MRGIANLSADARFVPTHERIDSCSTPSKFTQLTFSRLMLISLEAPLKEQRDGRQK
jgi:hypothetical protein